MARSKRRRQREAKGERRQRLEEGLTAGEETGSVPSRAGGNLARKVGTRDLLKRAVDRFAGITRIRKKDER